jgi:hypothetical protein
MEGVGRKLANTSAPLVRCDLSQRLVAAALWKRILVSSQNSIPAGEGGETALLALNEFRAAARNAAYVWRMYQAIPVLIERIGAPDAAAIVATTAWDRILGSHPAVFSSVFEVFYQAGGRRCIDAWEQFLAEQKNYAPSYWHFVLLMKCFVTAKHADFAAMAIRSLRRVQREDLTPLLAVYLQQMQQAPVAEIAAAARALTVANQRARVAEYVIDMGYAAEELPVIVTAFAALVGDSDADKAALALMQARLANAERRWRDTLELAERARAEPRHRQAADLLRAHALAGMNEAERAITVLDEIVAEPETAHFQRARATFIRVTAELARRGLPALQERPRKAFPATPGRPLAQSLRVGRKLRWIERLAIKSYLDNGWRFQLYAYDDPDNVPDGCEVLDAAAIIPAKDVFREGAGSGSHAGSLGAFPDLFRYQLLYKRGGMWTDNRRDQSQKIRPRRAKIHRDGNNRRRNRLLERRDDGGTSGRRFDGPRLPARMRAARGERQDVLHADRAVSPGRACHRDGSRRDRAHAAGFPEPGLLDEHRFPAPALRADDGARGHASGRQSTRLYRNVAHAWARPRPAARAGHFHRPALCPSLWRGKRDAGSSQRMTASARQAPPRAAAIGAPVLDRIGGT